MLRTYNRMVRFGCLEVCMAIGVLDTDNEVSWLTAHRGFFSAYCYVQLINLD